MNKMYIVDGNSLLFRAYYATAYNKDQPLMQTSDGIYTNAVFAFANMINRLLATLNQGDYFFVGFDTGKKTFRHQEDETYKANRSKVPDELISQMPLARELLKSLNIFTFEKEGFEGDDVCGTMAKRAKAKGIDVYIYTSDRDFLQLVSPSITVNLIKKGLSDIAKMDINGVKDKFGFGPEYIVDYKGLTGDKSDNIPGIPGIGDVTASKLINSYGTLENIILHAGEIKGKLGENILLHQEIGLKSKHLAIIYDDVPLPFDVEDTLYQGYSYEFVQKFANRYELKQFLGRLPAKFKISDALLEIEPQIISSFKDIPLDNKIGLALKKDHFNYHLATLTKLAITIKEDTYIINQEDLLKDSYLKDILENPSIQKYGFDLKGMIVLFKRYGINLQGVAFDIMLASYILDSSNQSDEENVFKLFGVDIKNNNQDDLALFNDNDNQELALISHHSLHLEGKIKSELDKVASLKLFNEIEMPLINVLAKMEIEGVPLSREKLLEIGSIYQEKMLASQEKIYGYANKEFNIDSPKQVGEVLYHDLKIASINKKESTNIEALNAIKDHHPIVEEIINYRKYAKLCSTYIDGLINHLFPDQKLHSIYNQALTQTGRLSSSEPNLQNISVRDEESKLIRQAFYYQDDYHFLSLDYSQIELRIVATLANSKSMQDVFNAHGDIHALTAQKIFHKETINDEERRKAKTVNFGIIYGISEWGLAEQIGVPINEAKEIIKAFYQAFPEINDYFNQISLEAHKQGYVTTLYGRRRYLKELFDTSYQIREFAKRAAVNAPIQGTAADIIKIAMIEVDKYLTENNFETKLIMQIHDELIFKLAIKEKDIVIDKIKEIMENILNDKIKLEVSIGEAKSWYEVK